MKRIQEAFFCQIILGIGSVREEIVDRSANDRNFEQLQPQLAVFIRRFFQGSKRFRADKHDLREQRFIQRVCHQNKGTGKSSRSDQRRSFDDFFDKIGNHLDIKIICIGNPGLI